jgi:chromosome segregation ATPase
MKKFVAGLLVGLLMATAFPAYGAVSSLVGKTIKKEVKVTMLGEPLEKKAILLDGVTYVPLRVITEKLGLQADFVNGEVVVRNKSAEMRNLERMITEKQKEIEETKGSIKYLKSEITSLEQAIIDNPEKKDWLLGHPQDRIEKIRPRLTEAESKLTTLQTELAELEKQKAALEAQKIK